ncbi:hypothetical protein AAFF_G00105900 [Aldrovandia affinis]|uniref:Uncharacterized protein n=1 Tax=Aldrovandia affinis TaxID=143900 RepID=A0AAD7WXW8_9TELE|nr:hypothetical protein AAFF_G00105900 [Aldrovandia affinis]
MRLLPEGSIPSLHPSLPVHIWLPSGWRVCRSPASPSLSPSPQEACPDSHLITMLTDVILLRLRSSHRGAVSALAPRWHTHPARVRRASSTPQRPASQTAGAFRHRPAPSTEHRADLGSVLASAG